jgi:hypothetical protein
MFPFSKSSNQQQKAPLLSAFVHRSPLATSPHDPHVCLASHCIRTAFGETVQLVADAIQTRGALSLKQLVAVIREKSRMKIPIPLSSVRASLLVLLQHSICTVDTRRTTKGVSYYVYHPDEAVYIIRYAKFVEYIRKAVDATSACVVETLLLAGRLRTIDVVLQAAITAPKSDRYTVRETVLEAFCKLAQSGCLQQVQPLKDDDDDEAEFEATDEQPPPKKKVKLSEPPETGEDAAVVGLLNSNAQYKATLPIDAVWKVNLTLFHACLRALVLGKLVSERFGHRIQSCGSMVTAALRHRSYVRHCMRRNGEADNNGDDATFSPQDIIRHLPKPVLQLIEKRVGSVGANLSKAFQQLSEFQSPRVVQPVGEHRYEICVQSLSSYLCDRIVHKIVQDRHGETAGRIISILSSFGYLESEKIAEHAMVPAKDTREVLHRLYRSNYVDIFQVSAARIPTPANTIYIWRADKDRLMAQARDNIALALWNMRLRRQHQVEIYGKDWIERAEQADEMDENVHETDRLNYERFCEGLMRLDNSVLELDETLMVLRDF